MRAVVVLILAVPMTVCLAIAAGFGALIRWINEEEEKDEDEPPAPGPYPKREHPHDNRWIY